MGAGDLVQCPPYVKHVAQPSQVVILVPVTTSLDVQHSGSSPVRTEDASDPFLLLPTVDLGAQIPPKGVLVPSTARC